MGLSELNSNNCFINNSIAMNGNDCETLLLATNHQNLQNISLIQRQTTHECTPIESLNIDIDMNPLIINTSEFNPSQAQQQILLVSSPMDLISADSIGKPSAVQMVLSELPLITNGTQLNVIQVPTNLLLTDNLIVIPQEGITLEVPSIDTTIALSPIQSQTTIETDVNYENKNWFNESELIAQEINAYQSTSNTSADRLALVSVALNNCITINTINSINKSDNNLIESYSTSGSNQNHFFDNNSQIIGIINDNSNQTKLFSGQYNTDNNEYDLNAFLASSLSSAIHEECDPNQAKQWHNDSVIAYRALMAFKKVMPKESCVQTCVQTK